MLKKGVFVALISILFLLASSMLAESFSYNETYRYSFNTGGEDSADGASLTVENVEFIAGIKEGNGSARMNGMAAGSGTTRMFTSSFMTHWINLTVNCWINLSMKPDGTGAVFSQDNDRPGTNWHAGFTTNDSGTRMWTHMPIDASATGGNITSDLFNTTHMYTWILRENSTSDFFIDGVQQNKSKDGIANVSDARMSNQTGNMCIGNALGDDGTCNVQSSYIGADLDDCRIWDYALNDSNVIQLYDIYNDTTNPNLNMSINNTSPKRYEVVNVTANVTDGNGLLWCQFVENMTGAKTYINKSVTGTSDQCSNTYNITVPRGAVINFSIILSDKSNNINFSQLPLIVANTPPFCSPNTLSNASPRTNDIINQTGCAYSDADNDAQQTSQYLWYKNNVLLAGETGATLNLATAGNGDKGDTINASERPYDGFGYGNWLNVSAFAVVQNTPPPAPTIISPTANLYTSSQPLNFQVTFPADTDNDVLSINYFINGTKNQTSLTDTTFNASDGYYILNVNLNDSIAIGNNASVNFTIDTTLPSISELKSNDTNNVTRNNAILNFTVTASDTNLFSISLNGTLIAPVGGNVFRLTSNASNLGCANEGICLLTARALDLAGNANNFSYYLIIDNTAPALSEFKAKNDTDNITRSDNVINFTMSISDANINNSNLNGNAMSSGTNEFYLVTTPSALGCVNGQCILTAIAIDKADNQNTILHVLTVDNLNPNIALNAPQNMANISGALNITVFVTDLIANISSVTAIQTLNGSAPVSRAYAMSLFSGTEGNGLWNLTFDSRTLRNGLASFRFNATDRAGNYNETLEINLMIDNMKPKVLEFNGIAVNNVNLSRNATINATAFDNITGVKNLVFNLNGTNNTAIDSARDGNNFIALLETKNFTDGFYNITAIPEDFAGNKEIEHVVISEVLYESAGGANSNEWIELYNPTNYPVNITNWVIDVKSTSSDATITNESIINPKSSFIIADNSTLFFSLYGFYPDLDQRNLSREFKLIGTNDFIRLKDSAGAVIDEVSWGNNSGGSYNWSLFADEGRTIARNPASGDVDEQYDWMPNAIATPGILANPNHITIKIDNTPPKIISFNGNAANGAFLKGTITINATVTDALSQVNTVIFAVSGSGSAQLNLSASQEQSFWSAVLDTALLADGNYNITVSANDSLNNINNTEFIEVTIDNNPPSISGLTPSNSSFANSTSILVSFVLKDNTTGVNASSSAVQLNYTLDAIGPIIATLNAPAAVAGGYNFSAAINTFNAERINLSVSAKDSNSNVMPTAKWSFSVDLVKPAVNSIQINDTDRILRSIDVVNITLNSTNGLAGIKNITIGSSAIFGMANAYSTIWQITSPAGAFGCSSDGICALAITSEDNAGNINNSESIILTIDNTNPQINNIIINNTIVSNITPVKINLTINDANFAIGAVTASNASSISLSNATTAPYWTAETTASALGCQQNGNCVIRIKAADSAGNVNNTETLIIGVDSSPPSVSTAAINDSNNIVKGSDVINMSLGVSDSNKIISIKGNSVDFAQAGSNWNAINKSSEFCPSEGLCAAAFAVQDNLSNTNSTQSFSFTIDNTAPSLPAITINNTNNVSRQDAIINFTIAATDANNISTLFLNATALARLNDTLWSTVNKTSSLCGANDGNCSLEFRAEDTAGNAQTLPLRLLVDSLNPQFSNPAAAPSTKYNTNNITLNITWADANGIAGVSFSHNATGSLQSYAGTLQDGYYALIINSSLLKNQQVIGWNSSAYDTAGNLNDSMALQTFKIENRAPALASIPNITIAEDSNATINLASYFTDADSDNLTYFVAAQPENITIILNSTSGAVKLSPKSDLFGERYVVFNATDGLAHTVSNNITINITNVNDAPILSTIPNIVFNEDSYNDSLNLDDFVSDVDNTDSQITWTASSLSSNVSIIITTNRIMNVSAIGNYSGTSKAFLTASDGSASIDTILFTITVNPVNDAPTAPALISPSNNLVFSTTNVTLSWQASKDNESSAITYYVLNSNDTAPKLNASTALTSYIMENLSVGKTYYWAVLASDGSLNSTLSEIRQYNTTANFAPNITAFYPNTTAFTMQEGQSQKFNITKADSEGNIINVTWFIDGALDNGSIMSDNITYTPNLTSAGLHNITAIVKDLFNVESRAAWLVTVANTNQAPTLIVPTALLNATEEVLSTFNITASDPDNDVLTFASNRSGISIAKFNYTAVINWTPSNSDVGITVIKFNVTDTGNLSASGVVSINVTNVNDAPSIAPFFPSSGNPIIAEETGTQRFNVTASDPDNDALTISWKLNGITNTTGNSYTAANLSAGNYNVTSIADDGSLSASRTWNLTVAATPVSKQYTSPIFSLNKTQLENAENVTINHTTFGAIDFGNNTLNLSGIVDLDSIINISNGVTAIDTERAPELNKPARIVWKSLNFTKSPFIYLNPGFKAEGNTPCPADVCTNITYDKTAGILTFNAAHFSTYFAGQNTTNDPPRITSAPPTNAVLNEQFSYQVEVADLDNSTFIFTLPAAPSGMSISSNGVISWSPAALGSYNVSVSVSDGIASDAQSFTLAVIEGARLRITDLDVKIDGKTSKNLRNNSVIRREAEPGSNVEFRIEIKNGFTNKENLEINDIAAEVTIESIDDGDDIEFEADEFDLKYGRDKTIKADFDIPLAVDEDTFDVFIRVNGEDENGTAHDIEWELQLEVNKDSHKLVIDKPSLNPASVSCNRNTRLSAAVVNVGQDEETDVRLAVESEPLEISQSEKDIFLDSGTEDISYAPDFSINVRDDLAAGTYPINVKAYRDSKLEDTKTISLKVDDCVVEKKQEVKEKVVVVKPTSISVQKGNQITTTKPFLTSTSQKPALKDLPKPAKVPFRDTDEYMLLLIATVITLTIGVFVAGSLMIFRMRR